MLKPVTPIDISLFEKITSSFFEQLMDQLEVQFSENFDEIEIENGALRIVLRGPNTKEYTFLVTRHTPTRQLWYASPFSGATHFMLMDSIWTSTQDAHVTFPKLLAVELTLIICQEVTLLHVS